MSEILTDGPECRVEGEWLQWVRVGAGVPDADTTVMLFVPGGDEEVWPGYWDGEEWYWVEGGPVEGVVAWGQMPKGWG